jgi:MFS family permease
MNSRRNQSTNWRTRIADYLALERNVATASAGFLLMGMGEELWKKFLPKYLESLGASALTVGAFGTAKDFLDAIYQYPGGWLTDNWGRRRAFLLFVVLASIGYFIYLFAPSWPFVFIGLIFAMAWSSMASPAIFAVIGDALPKEKRAMGFTLQSLLKRVPMAIAPLIGGWLIAVFGVLQGVRWGLMTTLVLAAVTLLLLRKIDIPIYSGETVKLRGVWQSFHHALKRLLISDIIIRTCEGLADVFIILYVTNVIGLSARQYGVLVATQMITSILVYLPAGRLADRIGRRPFVVVTFICFALFPFAIVLSNSFSTMIIAFMIGGLREIGEPSRKAMIVDLSTPHLRARTVGLYYLIRSLTVTPAAAIGGMLWTIAPATPFVIAGIVGMIGVMVFAVTVEERYAG